MKKETPRVHLEDEQYMPMLLWEGHYAVKDRYLNMQMPESKVYTDAYEAAQECYRLCFPVGAMVLAKASDPEDNIVQGQTYVIVGDYDAAKGSFKARTATSPVDEVELYPLCHAFQRVYETDIGLLGEQVYGEYISNTTGYRTPRDTAWKYYFQKGIDMPSYDRKDIPVSLWKDELYSVISIGDKYAVQDNILGIVVDEKTTSLSYYSAWIEAMKLNFPNKAVVILDEDTKDENGDWHGRGELFNVASINNDGIACGVWERGLRDGKISPLKAKFHTVHMQNFKMYTAKQWLEFTAASYGKSAEEYQKAVYGI